MKVYVSGKVTGLPLDVAKQRFSNACELLKELDMTPVNPLDSIPDEEMTWGWYMGRDLDLLMGCDAIFMLSNWHDSDGARVEHFYATNIRHIPALYEEAYIQDEQKIIMARVESAIVECTNLTLGDFLKNARNRRLFFARMIFIALCNEQGLSPDQIRIATHRDLKAVRYHLKKFDDEYRYNPQFKRLVNRVRAKFKSYK